MRFGLSDIRNYDSVELATSLRWFAPLYEPRRQHFEPKRNHLGARGGAMNASYVSQGRARVVAAAPPPDGAFARVEKIGSVWIVWLDALPWARTGSPRSRLTVERDDGWARIRAQSEARRRRGRCETYDPGWTALIDGKAAKIMPKLRRFHAN